MQTRYPISKSGILLAVCFFLSILIFSIDTTIPLGVAGGVPYILVILVTLYIPGNQSTMAFALATCLLTIAGLYTSPLGGEEWKVIFNRSLALFAICSTAFVVILNKKSTLKLVELNNDLEDIIEERTRKLEAAQDKLIESHQLALLGKLTSMVSHELRNPLSVINASNYLLQTNLKDAEDKIHNYFKRIDINVKRCDRIIDDLCDFSSNNKLTLTQQNLDKLIETTAYEYRLPENIDLKVQLNINASPIKVDASKIQRAIINALDNASQTLLDDNRAIERPVINIKTSLSDEKAFIEISDNGKGIAEKNIGKVFEPLYSSRSFGIGLGLPIIRKIMEQHRGGVKLSSIPDRGTRLLLWLPYPDPATGKIS